MAFNQQQQQQYGSTLPAGGPVGRMSEFQAPNVQQQGQEQYYMQANQQPMYQQYQPVMAQQPQMVIIGVDEADVKSKRFWNWIVSLEGSFYFYFIFELIMLILVNTECGVVPSLFLLQAGIFSYLNPQKMGLPANGMSGGGSDGRDILKQMQIGADQRNAANDGASIDIALPFSFTIVKMISTGSFLILMMVFRCVRISDLHWGQFRKTCGALIMTLTLTILAVISLLCGIVRLAFYGRCCSLLNQKAEAEDAPACVGTIGFLFPLIFDSVFVFVVLLGVIQIPIGYCTLHPKTDSMV
ncbi:unnamed protein product [Amoebophrya sp. A25]|nr:unnamed protein product [Amoebophrya sp. A25]|eukprot:GSA25T00001589001.1